MAEITPWPPAIETVYCDLCCSEDNPCRRTASCLYRHSYASIGKRLVGINIENKPGDLEQGNQEGSNNKDPQPKEGRNNNTENKPWLIILAFVIAVLQLWIIILLLPQDQRQEQQDLRTDFHHEI